MSNHEDFEQLAVGYAFHALEPADEQLMTEHLVSCATCFSMIIDAESVTTALAQLVPEATPSSDLRTRLIRAASEESPTAFSQLPDDPRLILTSPRHSEAWAVERRPRWLAIEAQGAGRRHLRRRFLAGAMAALVGIAVAVPTTLALSRSDSGQTGDGVLAEKMLESGSREVSLTSSSSPSHAKAVLTPTGALVIADDLPANDAQRTTYVLWAANRSGLRTAIATFDVTTGKATQVATGSLPFRVDEITQIVISLEPGRQAPPVPSDIVLSGSSA